MRKLLMEYSSAMRARKRFAVILIEVFLILVLTGSSCAYRQKRSGDLQLKKPPADYYTYTNLPSMSQRKIRAYCKMSDEEWKKYYQQKYAEAKQLSDRLERYIRDWYAGKASPKLPKGLLPPSIDNEKTKNWTLLRPEEVKPENQWYSRPANEIPEDFSNLYFLSPDNHCTYLKMIFVAPFDSQLLVEGDFPHARFMDYQILEPFDPKNPTTSGMGAPEVPIVDIDINPDPGHTNPFRRGANRNAEKRHYHLTFDLKAGNAVELNPEAMIPPAYRAPGNKRVGGPFASSGPQGDGQIVASVLWLRYYAPDKATGPFGGVALPKALLRLKSGETFWLQCDFSEAERRQNLAVRGFYTPPEDPPDFIGPTVGWFKMFGFWLTFAEGFAYPIARPWGLLPSRWAKKFVASRQKCLFRRGPDIPPPGNHEISASACNYHTYLFRVMFLGKSKVYALTGKLPLTPKTRNGEPVAPTGEARYWSICHTGNGEGKKYPGLLYGCLMDDKIVVNKKNEFIIVFSRRGERPSNARPECGVTWQAYGPESRQVFVLRWMSVIPDDYLQKHAPHIDNIPWSTGAWSQPTWNRKLIGFNNQDGVMGPYQPLIHYLTKEEFENLGCPVNPVSVPKWR
ncbi:MAG: hypothetical protein JRI22_07535 [Deltaproteobacteria bacterium]|nr:hypothetical protein [Deltaproteobacteria bacterium]